MAKNKEGFILYRNIYGVVELMSNAKAGELFKLILKYVNKDDDAPDPKSSDMMINVAFVPIKQHLKADLKKYESKRQMYSKMGKASAEKRKHTPVNKELPPYKSINHINYIKSCIDDTQWLETTAMQKKVKIDHIKKELTNFEAHLIQSGEQKPTLKQFKSHFTNWMNKKPPTKSNKPNYYS